MSLHSRYLTIIGLGLAAGLGACSDDSTSPSSPENFDSQSAIVGLETVDSAFNTDAFRSFASLGTNFGLPAGLAAGSASMLRTATDLDAPSLARRMDSAARQMMAAMTASAATLIPAQFRGVTLTYQPGTGYAVDTTRSDAPATGMRFVLYAVDPITDQPAEPLNEIGFADLIDESTTTEAVVRLVVVSQGTTFLNYTVSAAGPPTSPTMTIAGFITDGTQQANFTLTNALEVTFAGITADINYNIDVEGLNIKFVLHIEGQSDTESTVTVSVTLTAGADVVTISGTVMAETGTLEVRINGQLLATITLAPTGVTVVNGAGDPLSADEITVVEDLMDLVGEVSDVFDDLFDPVRFLFEVSI
ncbi:MAG: hypothetical protein ACE5HT_06880 [Gemmatimonadales bacterium]